MAYRFASRCCLPGLLVPAVALLAIAADGVPEARPADANDTVVVQLRSTAAVAGPRVTIRDVASLEKGDPAVRDRIGELDLVDFKQSDKPIWMLKEQVYYRICLANIDASQFRIDGASTFRISRASPRSIEDEILDAAKELVLQRVPAGVQNVSIQLATPIGKIGTRRTEGERGRLEAHLQSLAVPIGRVHVQVAMLAGDRVEATVPVDLIVRFQDKVAIAAGRIDRGELLTDKNVSMSERTLDSFDDYITSPRDFAGQRAKHPVPAGRILTKADLEPAPTDVPVLVKQQGLVRLVAQVGALELVTVGEAIQDGRSGQLIRVRNIDSKNVVVGRVIDHSTVRVDY